MSCAKFAGVSFLIVGLLISLPVQGATWHVEKDGSGDFTIIQDAVDAAADGDVIQIGPGRFDDYVTHLPWGDFRVWVHGDKGLTFVGAGPENTIIGPATYGGTNTSWGIYCDDGPFSIRIEGVRFENLNGYGAFLYSEISEVENCVFENCIDGCYFMGIEYGSIVNCEFKNIMSMVSRGVLFRAPSGQVIGSLFQNCRVGLQCDSNGNSGVVISNCVFDGGGEGKTGVYFDRSGGSIVGCHFRDLTSRGINCDQATELSVRDNVFERITGEGNYARAIELEGGNSFEATGNIFSSSDNCFLLSASFTTFSVYNNHFFRDEANSGFYVKTNPNWTWYEEHWDFSNNYWGTTDLDEIAQWIFDGNDSSETTMFVDFLPIADGPVGTERTSLDGLKAFYR